MSDFKFPFVSFQKMHRAIRDDIDAAIRKVIDSDWYIAGPHLAQFEKEFAAYCGSQHAIGVSNGLDALVLALRALNIGEGDEVIVPANSFIASALAISAVRATPVFVDVNEITFNVEPAAVAKAITKNTRAVMAVHLYGQAADVGALSAICEDAKIHLIEDAAQAHGAAVGGKKVGSFGVASGFSFYPGKNLGALGDGGAVTTNLAAVDKKVRSLRSYGSEVKYHHDEKGVNARLDELQAAVLSVKLKTLDDWTQKRRDVAKIYARFLKDSVLTLPVEPCDELSHSWHLYVVQVDRRDEVQKQLASQGVQTLVHYPIPIHLQKAYSELGYKRGDFPITEHQADRLLSLPLWVGLDATDCAQQILKAL